MADGVTHRLSGLENTLDRMSRYPDKVQKKIATRAMRKGANVLRDEARKRAESLDNPTTKSNISQNIVTQSSARLGRENGGVAMRVGVLGGARPRADSATDSNPGGSTQHWRLLEFGTQHMAAQPFFRPAMMDSKDGVFTTIASEFSQQLDRLELVN